MDKLHDWYIKMAMIDAEISWKISLVLIPIFIIVVIWIIYSDVKNYPKDMRAERIKKNLSEIFLRRRK